MRCLFLLAIAAALLFVSDLPAQTSPSWLGFPAGLNHPLTEEGDAGAVRIPINLLTGAPGLDKLQVRLRDVVFHEGRAEASAKTFTAQIDPGDQRRGPSLLIEAKPLPALPGSYVLSLDISETAPAAGAPPKVQPVTLTLQRPEPKVVASGPLIIDQTYGFTRTELRASRLRLTEQSTKAGLTGVKITDVRDPSANVPVDIATLNVSLQPAALPAGAVVLPEVKVQGDFPLGTSAGKLEVRADQLATPLTIAYEVRARRTTCWIALITLLGFGLGWVIRVYLRDVQRKAQVRAAASAVLHQIQVAYAEIPDADFQKALAAARKKLTEAARSADLEAVQKAATDAASELAAARTALAASSKLAMDALGPLRELVAHGWKLPPGLPAELLVRLRREVADATRLVEVQNIVAAQERLSAIPVGVLPELVVELSKWRRNADSYLARLVEHPPAIPPDGVEELRKAVESWRANFAAQTSTATLVTTEEATKALDSGHQAYMIALQIADELITDSKNLVKWVVGLFPAAALPPNHRLASLEAATLEATWAIRTDLNAPEKAEPLLADRERGLSLEWESVLTSLVPAAATAIHQALARHQWSEAATAAAAVFNAQAAPAAGGNVQATQGAQTAPAAGPIAIRASVASAGAQAPIEAAPVPELTGSAAEREALAAEAWLASIVQTLFFALLFMVVAYVLYSGKWVGTLHEMLALFIWAFGVDITSEAVMNAAKGIKLPDA